MCGIRESSEVSGFGQPRSGHRRVWRRAEAAPQNITSQQHARHFAEALSQSARRKMHGLGQSRQRNGSLETPAGACRCANQSIRSTRHVEDGVGVLRVLLQHFEGFERRQDEQFNLAVLGLALHFFHYRQSAIGAGADDELTAFPRYLLVNGQGRVSKVVAEFLGPLFLAFAYFPAVNEDVMRVSVAIDLEGAKGETVEAHCDLCRGEE